MKTKYTLHKKNIYIPILTSPVDRDFCALILFIPLWWLLGFRIFIFHALVTLMFIKLLVIKIKKKEQLYLPKTLIIFVFFCLLYVLSLLSNFSQAEIQRIYSSLYNFSLWIIGFFLVIIVFEQLTFRLLEKILRYVYIVGFIAGVISVGSIFLWIIGLRNISFDPLFFQILPVSVNFPLANDLIKIILSESDWILNGPFPRSRAFFAYPNALGGSMIIMIPYSLAYIKLKRSEGVKKSYIPIGFMIFALIFTNSRISILAILIAVCLVVFLKNKNKIIIIMLMLSIIFLVSPFIDNIIQSFLLVREGSSLSRLDNYRLSLKYSMQKPLIGHGIKPLLKSMEFPLGSHSTYTSLLIKTGILGLFLFLSFQVGVFSEWIRKFEYYQQNNRFLLNKLWAYFGIALLGSYIWVFSEDLDAPPIVTCLFFINIGIILAYDKLVKGTRD